MQDLFDKLKTYGILGIVRIFFLTRDLFIGNDKMVEKIKIEDDIAKKLHQVFSSMRGEKLDFTISECLEKLIELYEGKDIKMDIIEKKNITTLIELSKSAEILRLVEGKKNKGGAYARLIIDTVNLIINNRKKEVKKQKITKNYLHKQRGTRWNVIESFYSDWQEVFDKYNLKIDKDDEK